MNMTILFDLDDTLLSNNMDTFLSAYLKALSASIPAVPQGQFIQTLLFASQKMTENMNPALALEEVFDQHFYPGIGIPRADINEDLNAFYRDRYPALRTVTQPRPQAVAAVQHAFQRGWQVVVATNPLFPQTATHQRLAWAGLSAADYPFALVTTYEAFHFAKPNPAYCAEILGQLGCPEGPVVMVGNSLEDDLLPAAVLGIPGYWVTEDGTPVPAELPAGSAAGSLAGLIPWLEARSAESFTPQLDTPAALLAWLRAAPAAVAALTQPLSPAAWAQRPAAEEWSLTEILAHLRDVDLDVNLPRFQKLAAESNPFLPGVDTDSWAEQRGYRQQNGPECLRQFVQARIQLIQHLSNLPAEAWQQTARHAIFGPTTLQELVRFIITHDRSHLQQISDTLRQIQA